MSADVIQLRPLDALIASYTDHQPRLFLLTGTDQIAVSCSCRCRPGGSYAPLECRAGWDAGAVMQVHREHMAGEMLAAARRDKATDFSEGNGR